MSSNLNVVSSNCHVVFDRFFENIEPCSGRYLREHPIARAKALGLNQVRHVTAAVEFDDFFLAKSSSVLVYCYPEGSEPMLTKQRNA